MPDKKHIKQSWLWNLIPVVISCSFIVCSIYAWKGGYLHNETDAFLVSHLSDRSMIEKVLCPHLDSARFYQARELSHLFENIDAHFILWSVDHGFPHFLSIVTYLLLTILSIGFWRFMVDWLGMKKVDAVLLLTLFWTTPCIFLSGPYFRDAKQLTTVFLFFLIFLILKRVFGNLKSMSADLNVGVKKYPGSRLWILTFFLALAACWSDRQGFFLTAAILLIMMFAGLWFKGGRFWIAVTALMAALVLHSIWNYYIGPLLIRHVNDVVVSFEYQKPQWNEFFNNPSIHLWRGLILMTNTLKSMLGNVSSSFCILFVFIAGYTLSRISGTKYPTVIFLMLLIVLLSVMNTFMIMRLPQLVYPSMLTTYYVLPATVLFFTVLMVSVCQALKYNLISRSALRLSIIMIIALNLANLPGQLEMARNYDSGMRGRVEHSRYLLDAIGNLHDMPESGIKKTVPFNYKLVFKNTQFLLNPLETDRNSIRSFVLSSAFFNWLMYRRGSYSGK